MGHIKEPEGIDFLIESKPLTNKERKEISEFIKLLKKRKYIQKSKSIKKKKVTEKN